jgi:hypothetical protein
VQSLQGTPDPSNVRGQLILASQQILRLRDERNETKEKLIECEGELRAREEALVSYGELQRAHAVQAMFLQKLQGEAAHLTVYKVHRI